MQSVMPEAAAVVDPETPMIGSVSQPDWPEGKTSAKAEGPG